jgi:hypothetical protein
MTAAGEEGGVRRMRIRTRTKSRRGNNAGYKYPARLRA